MEIMTSTIIEQDTVMDNIRLRIKFTDEQVEKMEEYYEKGMRFARNQCLGLINSCSEETNLKVEYIKTWIGNRNKKEMKSNIKNPLEQYERCIKQTGYSVFLTEYREKTGDVSSCVSSDDDIDANPANWNTPPITSTMHSSASDQTQFFLQSFLQ